MKKIYALVFSSLLFLPLAVNASCTTFGSVTTCSDGNTYNQVGNTTFGSNARTGSTWSQTTIGNSTFGTASDGSSWSSTRIGNITFGTDSRGNSFTCIGQTCY